MKTKILKISSVFVAVIIAFSCFTFSTCALSPKYTFDFPIARPDLEDFSVFLEILYTTDGGSSVRAEIVGVVAPYTFNNANASADSLKVTISKTNFVVSVPENSNLGALSWFYMKDTGQMYFLTGLNSIGQGLTQVLSIRVYGNAYVVDNHGSMSSYSNFVFNYGTDALMDDKLDSVIAILQNSNQNVIDNANQNASQIQQNQDKNTDKIINAGSDKAQPDFGSTNNQLDSTTAEMQAVENGYKIDEAATTQELSKGSAFISSTDMQLASVQVKTWIEEFASDNKVISSFMVAALCLGLCFWVIGRKSSK